MKKLITSIIACSTLLVGICGGGWTNPKGEYYVKLNQSILSGNKFFSKSGELTDITTFSLYTTSVYGEYGIQDRLTGIVNLPFLARPVLNREVSANTGAEVAPGDSYTGIGDIDLGVKYGILKDSKFVLAGSVYLGLPTGAVGVGKTQLLQTGDGEFNQMLQLDLSTSFSNFFTSVRAGINNRTKGFSEEFRYGAEFGYAKGKVIAIGKLDGVESLFNGDENAGNGGSIFSNNLEYMAWTVEAGYFVTKSLGIGASIIGAISGRNILGAPNYNASIFYQFKK